MTDWLPTPDLLTVVREARIRRDIIGPYATAIVTNADVDWASVNQAIINRWSLSALRYIKERAWRAVAEVRADA